MGLHDPAGQMAAVLSMWLLNLLQQFLYHPIGSARPTLLASSWYLLALCLEEKGARPASAFRMIFCCWPPIQLMLPLIPSSGYTARLLVRLLLLLLLCASLFPHLAQIATIPSFCGHLLMFPHCASHSLPHDQPGTETPPHRWRFTVAQISSSCAKSVTGHRGGRIS